MSVLYRKKSRERTLWLLEAGTPTNTLNGPRRMSLGPTSTEMTACRKSSRLFRCLCLGMFYIGTIVDLLFCWCPGWFLTFTATGMCAIWQGSRDKLLSSSSESVWKRRTSSGSRVEPLYTLCVSPPCKAIHTRWTHWFVFCPLDVKSQSLHMPSPYTCLNLKSVSMSWGWVHRGRMNLFNTGLLR